MFNNREIRIRAVNTKKADNATPTTNDTLNPETIKLLEQTGNRIVKRVIITVATAVVAVKLIDILGEIAVKKTKSADNE